MSTSAFSVVFRGENLAEPVQLYTAEGQTADVFVRVCSKPARHLMKIIAMAEDEAPLIDFVTQVATIDAAGKITGYQNVPEGWADNLTDESHVKLLEIAKKLNLYRAILLAQRRIAVGKELAPVMTRWMALAASARESASASA